MRLTDLSIKRLRVPVNGRVTYTDDTLPGFSVRVTASGVKTFTLMYGRNRKRITIGRYPAITLAEARAKARELGVSVSVFQSNDEGAIIDFLQKEAPGSLGIVINPAALSHYSLALYDCLQALEVPAVEVHISNIHAREEFRSKSVTARAARGVITGLGFKGYELAMEYLATL